MSITRRLQMKLNSKNSRSRTGAAVMEMAICLPVLVFLVWGTIELTGSMFLKQTLTSAAHEGAMTGMRLNATEADVRERVALILKSRELTDCSVVVSPSGNAFDEMSSGDTFFVSISKGNQNSFINISSVAVKITSQRP